MLGVQLFRQVIGAHHQHTEAGAGSRNLLTVQHGDGGLNHGPQGGLVGRAEAVK